MKEIFEQLATLKIPTLTLIGIFFYTGYQLVISSTFYTFQGIAGSIILCVGFVLAVVLFVDYRYKEQSEHIIKQQGKALDNIGKALKNTSETHSRIEKNTQAEFSPKEKIGKEGRKEYEVEGTEGTLSY